MLICRPVKRAYLRHLWMVCLVASCSFYLRHESSQRKADNVRNALDSVLLICSSSYSIANSAPSSTSFKLCMSCREQQHSCHSRVASDVEPFRARADPGLRCNPAAAQSPDGRVRTRQLCSQRGDKGACSCRHATLTQQGSVWSKHLWTSMIEVDTL